jgi:serine/threonine protein kinase/formylglycine-generating enzyme required for sulfatase activity
MNTSLRGRSRETPARGEHRSTLRVERRLSTLCVADEHPPERPLAQPTAPGATQSVEKARSTQSVERCDFLPSPLREGPGEGFFALAEAHAMTEESIFIAALERPSEARTAYLEEACAGDVGLRARVEGLLAAHAKAGEFLARPAFGPPGRGDTTATFAAERRPGDTDATDGEASDAEEALGFLAPPRRPESLGRIGHYEVLEVLGRGGFGVVFRAFDEVLQRVVAVKVLAPSLAVTSPARKRFLREARSAALIQHESVVRIHETGEEPLPFLVMEFVPGETLQQKLDRTGPLDAAETLRIAKQVAEGLAAAHERGLIHRDIKPSNILIESGPQQRVKITDFGLARAADDASLTRSGLIAGTPMYMAPEQARGESLDHRADLFSLGSVMYTMLTGRPPFRAETTFAVLKRVAEDAARPMREVIPEVPEWLCRIVEKLHAKDPAGRFASAKEVADLLGQHLAHLQQPALVPMPEPVASSAEEWLAQQGPRRKVAALYCGVLLTFSISLLVLSFQEKITRFLPAELLRSMGAGGILGLLIIVYILRLQWADYYKLGLQKTKDVAAAPPRRGRGKWEWAATAVFLLVIGVALAWWRGWVNNLFAPRPAEGKVARHVESVLQEELPPATPPAADDFVSLFNGKDLQGWKQLPAEQGGWRVEKGVLVAQGPGGNLFSERGDYQDFYLRAEALIDPGADSGIFLRAPFRRLAGQSPYEVQIFGGPGGQYKTGSFWGIPGAQAPDPPVRPGEWFTLEAIARGNELTVKVNGTGTATWRDLKHTYAKGHIGLQHLGKQAGVRFRKIEIKELPVAAPTEGWVQLFNGKDLSGWKAAGPEGKWRVENGVLVGDGPFTLLRTGRADYRNFHLRYEAQYVGTASCGQYFRARAGRDTPPDGYRANVSAFPGALSVWADKKSKDLPSSSARVPSGIWYTQEVITEGNRLIVKVNGATTADVNNDEYAEGFVGLQIFDGQGEVRFRKIEVKELPTAADKPDPTRVKALQEAVAAKERSAATARVKFDAGKIAKLELILGEIELIEARVLLAEAGLDRGAMLGRLQELVAHRQEERQLTELLIEAGRLAPDTLNPVDARLADAKALLAKARGPAPPAAAIPFDTSKAKDLQRVWAKHLGVPVESANSIGMQLCLIPPGEFAMTPDYHVTITKPFRIGAHEVTIAQFRAFVKDRDYKTTAEQSGKGGTIQANGKDEQKPEYIWSHPSVNHGDDSPVGQLSWQDAGAFCAWLSKKEGKTYRLPTEAEWEWACRAGSAGRYHFGDDAAKLGDYAWFADNADGKTHPVGTKKPNAWGLFDTHGNIAEYCLDRYAEELPKGKATDPRGPAEGDVRSLRGLGYIDGADGLTASARAAFDPNQSLFHFGLRVVCEDVAPTPVPDGKGEKGE